MKDKISVFHDDVMVKKLRLRPQFAGEYLKAAVAETDDPKTLLVARRQIAKAHGVANVANADGLER